MSLDHLRNKWSRLTSLEKSFIVLVLFLLLLVVFLMISVITSEPENNLCTSQQCMKAANHILDMVNFTADPCDDFYLFACGNFLNTPKQQQTPLEALTNLGKNQIRSIIMGPEQKEFSRGVKLQRKLFRSCVDEDALDADNNTMFLRLIDQIGGWPLLMGYSFDEAKFDWMSTMARAAKIGLPYDFFLKIKTFYDVNGSETNVLSITPPFHNDIIITTYSEIVTEVMKDVVEELGAASVGAAAEIRTVLNFIEEFNLLVLKMWNNTKYDSEYNITTISRINQKYIYKPWMVFLNQLTEGAVRLKSDDKVMVRQEDYLRDLYYLLVRTPKRIQANYIAWYMLMHNHQYLTKSIRDKLEVLSYMKSGKTSYKGNDRKEECFWMVRRQLPYVLEGEYIRKFVDSRRIRDIKLITSNIKQQFITAFKHNDWMDKDTKELLMERTRNITDAIGWTDLVYDPIKFEEKLELDQFNFASDNLVSMMTDLRKHLLKSIYASIGKKTLDLDEEVHFPQVDVNAYFLHILNTIVLPAPIIQDFIFNSDRPQYLNYGALGSIIGHELTHSFILDKDLEDKVDFDWMTNASMATYYDKVNCVVEAYSSYLNDSLGIFKPQNSSSISSENIADITGQSVAYRAYVEHVKEHGTEKHLPGINLSNNQIFWVMSSTYLCFDYKKNGVASFNSGSRHADAALRVIGSLRNSPYFADDFLCSPDSNMNPTKKCAIFT